jgi:hypothetical protein
MKTITKTLLATLVLISSAALCKAQSRSEGFELILPEQKVQNSLYNAIKYLDSRYDTTQMGIVQLGAFNKKAKVVAKTPIATQLTGVLNSLVDTTRAKEGELLFQLRQLSFAEITGATSEKGYCYLKAALYANTGSAYHKLSSIDTVIYIKSMDVTKALFRNGSKTITNLIANNLEKEASDTQLLSFTDIVHMDSLEKSSIALYNTAQYQEGLYESYQSFKKQAPDQQITVEMKGDKISSVKTFDENGKSVKVKAKDIYAVVYKGQPFIATEYGYYPLQKISDDFLFTGKAKVTANTGDVIAASLFFGIIGGLIASDAEATFEMKIDHTNGGFIRLREIKNLAE